MGSEDLRRALADGYRAVAADPMDWRTLVKLGDLHVKLDEIEEAISLYDCVARIAASQGQHVRAVGVWRQILSLLRLRTPDLAARIKPFVVHMATSYAAIGLTDDAIAAFEEHARLLEMSELNDDAAELRRHAAGVTRP